jgi:hypothetical protein
MRGCRPRAALRRTWSRDVVVAARLGHINATLLISLPVPPVVIRTQRPQPERMAAGGGGGDARRKHGAFTVGGAGRRHSGAPILRRYAATSALYSRMANLSAVSPTLQRRE